MSIKVREWLKALKLYDQTTHEDRLEIDREVERRTGVHCDYALERELISKQDFIEIVNMILQKKKRELAKLLEKLEEGRVIV
jgi:NCAIR mutase (PurE)-related protein